MGVTNDDIGRQNFLLKNTKNNSFTLERERKQKAEMNKRFKAEY